MGEALVQSLRSREIDLQTAREAGMVGLPDELHLRFATEQGRSLYSFNMGDYYQLHTSYLNQGLSHAGIILARQDQYSIGEQMRRLLRLVSARTPEEMIDQIEFL